MVRLGLNQHDACNSDYFDVLGGLELFRFDDNGTARLKGSIKAGERIHHVRRGHVL